MSIDASKIKAGDRVKVSLYGLPGSDWLEVKGFGAADGEVAILMPDGDQPLFPAKWITAHEPAAPALPAWWGSLVIFDADEYGVFDGADHYTFSDGDHFTLEELRYDDVTVIVDRDGNQPAAEGYRQDALTEIQNRLIVEAAETQEEYERRRADHAEATLARVREAVNRHPAPCTDTEWTCGWKSAVIDVRDALDGQEGA